MTRPEPDEHEIDVPPCTPDMLMDAIKHNINVSQDNIADAVYMLYEADSLDNKWRIEASNELIRILHQSVIDAEQTASDHAWALHHERNDK